MAPAQGEGPDPAPLAPDCGSVEEDALQGGENRRRDLLRGGGTGPHFRQIQVGEETPGTRVTVGNFMRRRASTSATDSPDFRGEGG